MKINKKGFTLIELLAVIVILGVIMVIAVPAVTKYIDRSRKDGFTKTATGIVDAARMYYSNEYGQSASSEMTFECTNKVCESETGEKLELTKNPEKGTVKIFNDGEIIACFQRDTWYAVKNLSDNEVKFGEGKCVYDSESESYDTIELVSREMVDDLEDQLKEKEEELEALKSRGDAKDEEILENKKALVKGKEITGTMPNKGALTQTLTAGGSLTLAPGYYAGGTITANTLASQTDATAIASDLLSSKTAYVKGNKITGTMPNKGALNQKISAGGSLDLLPGYYSGGNITTSSSVGSSGTITGFTSGRKTINLDFTPSKIIMYYNNSAEFVTFSNMNGSCLLDVHYKSNAGNYQSSRCVINLQTNGFWFDSFTSSPATFYWVASK